MKKFFLTSVIAIVSITAAMAQYNPLQYFPNTEGSVLVAQTYDQGNNLLGSMKWTILESDSPRRDGTTNISFALSDPSGNVINRGTMKATYEDERFIMHMDNVHMFPDIYQFLSLETKIIGDFLDYPDPLSDESYFGQQPFKLGEGSLAVQSPKRSGHPEYANIQVYGRQLEGYEDVTTPAGTFNAAKITFSITVHDRETGGSTDYSGTEWFYPGLGIIRSQIRERDGDPMNYTVLTQYDIKK